MSGPAHGVQSSAVHAVCIYIKPGPRTKYIALFAVSAASMNL